MKKMCLSESWINGKNTVKMEAELMKRILRT